jgi:tape measure domain-containing protein
MDGVAKSTEKAGKSTRLLRSHLIAAGAAFGGLTLLPKLFGALDQFGQLQNRLRVVTEDGEAAQRMFHRLSDVALSTRSSLRGTVEMFTRISLATRNLGIEQERVVRLTRSINQAIIISGATAKEAENGLIQLSQGLASGALRGDELRSVLEQLPAVADVIARRLQVTRGELRKMGEEGLITTGVIVNAFEAAAEALQTQFGTQIITLSQSLENLKTVFTRDVGQSFSDFGGMNILIGSVQTLSVAIPILFKALMILAVLFAGRFATGVYLSYWRLIVLNKAARATTLSVGLLGETVTRTTAKLTLMQRVLKLGLFGKFALIATGISLAWTAVNAIFGQTADSTEDLNTKFKELDETIQSTGLVGAEKSIAEYEKYGKTVINIVAQLEGQLKVEQKLLKEGNNEGYWARKARVDLIDGLKEQLKLEKTRLAILSRGYDTGNKMVDELTGKLEEQVAVLEMRNRIETQYGSQREKDRANAMYDFVRAVEKSVGVQNMESETVKGLIRRYAEAWEQSMRLKDAHEAKAAAGKLLINVYEQLRGMIKNIINAQAEATDKFDAAVQKGEQRLERLRFEVRGTTEEWDKYSTMLDLVSDMDGPISPDQITEIDRIAGGIVYYNAALRDQREVLSAIEPKQLSHARLMELVNDSIITQAQALEYLASKIKDAEEDTEDLSTALWEGFAQTALSNTENAIADFVVRGKGNFKSFVTAVMEDLLRMTVRLMILLPLINALKNAFNAPAGDPPQLDFGNVDAHGNPISTLQNGGSFLVGQPTSRFPGFANGGGMKVGGIGGTDSQLVAFRASPNEQVTVTRPEQSIGGGTTVNVLVQNNAPGTEARVEKGQNGDTRVIIDQIKGAISADISRGGTGLNAALEGRYGLNGASGIQLG